MKTKIYIVLVLLVIVAMIAGGFYLNQRAIDNAYNYAITLIQNGSYEGALAELEKANPEVLDRDGFMSDVKYGGLDEAYKNTIPLYAYAMAQLEYNDEDRYMQTVNEYLELIPADYNGELCEKINTFKGNFKPQYEDFLAEQKRLAEEQRKKDEERRRIREQEEAEQLKKSVPYVGMSESKINGTVLGTNYELVHNYEWISGERIRANVYRFKKGNGIIFVVRCLNGRVDSISDHRDDPWIIRNPSTSKKDKKDDDPYNVNDYSNEEDFYYDNYDDFWDYEDAEDYYREHHKD